MSCSVWFSECPMWSAPVMFGGGSTMQNGGRSEGAAWKRPRASHSAYHRDSVDAASYCGGMSVWTDCFERVLMGRPRGRVARRGSAAGGRPRPPRLAYADELASRADGGVPHGVHGTS